MEPLSLSQALILIFTEQFVFHVYERVQHQQSVWVKTARVCAPFAPFQQSLHQAPSLRLFTLRRVARNIFVFGCCQTIRADYLILGISHGSVHLQKNKIFYICTSVNGLSFQGEDIQKISVGVCVWTGKKR